jgi:hypothetical protein
MKTTSRVLALSFLLLFVIAVRPARASFTFTLSQVGNNVMVSGSGTFDLTNLTLNVANNGVGGNGIHPSVSNLFVGPTTPPNVDVYAGLTGPSSFGSGGSTAESSGSGNEVLLQFNSQFFLGVPANYVSGSALADNATYSSATLASLGITPGTYTYTWGSGPHADSLVINAAVPEPGTSALALFGGAAVLLSATRRRVSTGR